MCGYKQNLQNNSEQTSLQKVLILFEFLNLTDGDRETDLSLVIPLLVIHSKHPQAQKFIICLSTSQLFSNIVIVIWFKYKLLSINLLLLRNIKSINKNKVIQQQLPERCLVQHRKCVTDFDFLCQHNQLCCSTNIICVQETPEVPLSQQF